MRYREERGFRTVSDALAGSLRAAELKKLAGLLAGSLPTRKAELVQVILRHMEQLGVAKTHSPRTRPRR